MNRRYDYVSQAGIYFWFKEMVAKHDPKNDLSVPLVIRDDKLCEISFTLEVTWAFDEGTQRAYQAWLSSQLMKE